MNISPYIRCARRVSVDILDVWKQTAARCADMVRVLEGALFFVNQHFV